MVKKAKPRYRPFLFPSTGRARNTYAHPLAIRKDEQSKLSYLPSLDLPFSEMHLVKVSLSSDPFVLFKVVIFFRDGYRGFFLQGTRSPRILLGFLWRRGH